MDNESNEKRKILNEPVGEYKKTINEELVIPKYVFEDLKIGLEEYRRGEIIRAEEVLKRIKHGV